MRVKIVGLIQCTSSFNREGGYWGAFGCKKEKDQEIFRRTRKLDEKAI